MRKGIQARLRIEGEEDVKQAAMGGIKGIRECIRHSAHTYSLINLTNITH
jgi:hypothetical protein